MATTTTDSDWLADRRAALKLQQEALERGEVPPPIPATAPPEPAPIPEDGSCTQVPRNAGTHGYPSGSHLELRNSSGTQESIGVCEGPGDAADLVVPASMPLGDYIRFAAEKNQAALEYADGWQGAAFTFTRYLKTHPDLRDLSSQAAADVVDRLLAAMYPRSEDPWAELLGDADSAGSYSDPFEHFAEAWDSVQYPMGETPLEQAVRLAEEHPLPMPGYPSARWAPYRRFVSICRWLQFAQDGENIFVPVRKFGELIGRPKMTISNYRKRAERDGYLILVKEHQGRSRATEFRFNMEMVTAGADDDEVRL